MDTLALDRLKEKLTELAYLRSTSAILAWDEQVFMPTKGAHQRSQTLAYLAGLSHERFLALDQDGSLTKLKKLLDTNTLNDHDSAIVREVWREYNRQKKLPAEFVKKVAETTSKAHLVWASAREKAQFSDFLPALSEIISLTQQEAEYVGFKESPYDALLDVYEPELTSSQVTKIFDELKGFLVPFLLEIKNSKVKTNPDILKGHFPTEKQVAFNKEIAQAMGFDFEAGRIDVSHHPFAEGLHPHDVRITTRYDESFLFSSFFGTMHEVGHALYEQGLEVDHFGTPLGEAGSYGLHESQSILWEKPVGRSHSFWQYCYPLLQQHFPKPFKNIGLGTFYRAINHVSPSLIRTEADEVTYALHIILRFEIEKALIEGTLPPDQIPMVWNQKVKDYLGIDVPNDAVGCLQDVHWSAGLFGYFPAYALGATFASQLFAAAQEQIPNLDTSIQNGQLQPLREWLRQQIHRHGKMHSTFELLEKVTGQAASPTLFIKYLSKKYNHIYELSS